MKFTKSFYGCKAGDIYPTQFKAGEECPPELLDAAKDVGAVEAKPAKGKTAVGGGEGGNGNPDA